MTDLTWATIGVSLVIGLVLLIALRPLPERATRLLKRWGVPDPDEPERAEALRYLKRRRLAYPWLYVAGSLVLGRVPRWALGLWAVLAIVAIGTPVVLPASDPTSPLAAPAVAAGLAVAALAAGLVVVGLAVRRPPARVDRADAALRLRSARVGAGLSMAALGLVGGSRGSVVGIALVVLGLLGWMWVTARIPATPSDGRAREDAERGDAARPGTAAPPDVRARMSRSTRSRGRHGSAEPSRGWP